MAPSPFVPFSCDLRKFDHRKLEDLLSPNNRMFHQLIESRRCVMESMHGLAGVFRSENVSVCEVDADKFKSFFCDFKLRELPNFDSLRIGWFSTITAQWRGCRSSISSMITAK
jgi:hypothetical protein